MAVLLQNGAARGEAATGGGPVTQSINQFVTDETGANLIEYALLAGLLSMACFLALSSIGSNLSTFLSSLATKVASIAP